MKCPKCGEDMSKIKTGEFYGFYVCFHGGEFLMSYFDETGDYIESITDA